MSLNRADRSRGRAGRAAGFLAAILLGSGLNPSVLAAGPDECGASGVRASCGVRSGVCGGAEPAKIVRVPQIASHRVQTVAQSGSLLDRRPPSGLGGVRSQAPRGYNRTGSLLPRHTHTARPRPSRPDNTGPIIIVPGGRTGRSHVRDRDGFRHGDRSGIHVDGRFHSDRFRARFHLGHSVFPAIHCPVWIHPWYGYNRYWDYPPVITGTWAEVDPFVTGSETPQTAEAAPEPPPTLLELGDALLRAGRAREAIPEYREHLASNPGDSAAVRSLALALLETGQEEEGVAVMAMAYESDPSLAWRPVDGRDLPEGMRGLRARVVRAVEHAHRVDTASAWLTVAVLMQAQGRDEVATKMVARAKEHGLEGLVERELKLALAR